MKKKTVVWQTNVRLTSSEEERQPREWGRKHGDLERIFRISFGRNANDEIARRKKNSFRRRQRGERVFTVLYVWFGMSPDTTDEAFARYYRYNVGGRRRDDDGYHVRRWRWLWKYTRFSRLYITRSINRAPIVCE